MIKYRPEIDGLRAVAVLSVLLFHAGFGTTPGGFIGVDVFFVISGFLITSIIMKEAVAGEFTYSRFYERRIRRLLPPLIPVLLASLAGSFFLLDTPQFRDFVYSCYAAIGFVANWFFLSSVDYFDGPGEITPLLHVWSLSIEEQFYFIFPALFLLCLRKRPKALTTVFIFFAALSFLYSNYLLGKNAADTAFYSSPARFWELLVGSLLAISGARRHSSGIKTDIVETVGALLLVVPIVIYTKDLYFPGAAALLPVVGTALIIYAGGNGRVISPILRSKTVVALGLVSYSLYLWHWPILVFIKLVSPGAGIDLMMFGLLLALFLAICSYYLIEGPIRNKKILRKRTSIYVFSGASFALVICASMASVSGGLNEVRVDSFAKVRGMLFSGGKAELISKIEQEKKYYLDNLNINYSGDLPKYDSSVYPGWTCSYDKGNTLDRIFDCLNSQVKKNNVLVLGDSIARDTTHALRRGYPDVNFITIHQSSCPPADVGACYNKSRELFERVGKAFNFDAVIINFRYRPQDWKNVESGIDAAKLVSQNVIMFGVSPLFTMPPDNLLKFVSDEEPIPVFISEHDKRLAKWSFKEIADSARTMAEQHGASFIPILDFYCPGGQCKLWIDNRPGDPLYIDEQHLSSRGMSEFGEFLKSQKKLAGLLSF